MRMHSLLLFLRNPKIFVGRTRSSVGPVDGDCEGGEPGARVAQSSLRARVTDRAPSIRQAARSSDLAVEHSGLRNPIQNPSLATRARASGLWTAIARAVSRAPESPNQDTARGSRTERRPSGRPRDLPTSRSSTPGSEPPNLIRKSSSAARARASGLWTAIARAVSRAHELPDQPSRAGHGPSAVHQAGRAIFRRRGRAALPPWRPLERWACGWRLRGRRAGRQSCPIKPSRGVTGRAPSTRRHVNPHHAISRLSVERYALCGHARALGS